MDTEQENPENERIDEMITSLPSQDDMKILAALRSASAGDRDVVYASVPRGTKALFESYGVLETGCSDLTTFGVKAAQEVAYRLALGPAPTAIADAQGLAERLRAEPKPHQLV